MRDCQQDLLTDSSLPDLPATQPRRGHVCAAPECETLVLRPTRFCSECYSDAAKDLTRKLEAQLVASGFAIGSQRLRDVIAHEASFQPLRWYEATSMLGELSPTEAVYLRSLTETACLLFSLGGVAALANLPGTRRHDAKKGSCDFPQLPQHTATEPRPTAWRADLVKMERRYQTYCAAVLLIMMLAVLAVRF